MTILRQSFLEHADAIDTILADFFADSIASASSIHPRYALLWRELSRVTQNGGKRLRPKITIMAYQAFGGQDIKAILPIAAAQEIFHTSLLLHDDIIDREQARRGEPNVSGAYDQMYHSAVVDPDLRRHYSDSMALLGGDLLLAATFRLISRSTLPPDAVRAAENILHRVIFEVAGGQLLDTELSFLRNIHVPSELVARYKTASYSFVAPLQIGGTLAGASSSSKHLEEFAVHLGIAYQLDDDLIGTYGTGSLSGKSTCGDLREGKRTYLVEQFLSLASHQDVARFSANFGRSDASDRSLSELAEIIERSGAKSATESRIAYHVDKARSALPSLRLSHDGLEAFELLVATSTGRHA